jgi:hypothetical protein
MRRVRYLVGNERAPNAGTVRVRAALSEGGDVGRVEGAVDDQLAAALEEVEKACRPVRPLEAVVLLHGQPRHTPTLGRQGVARPSELLLLHQHSLPGLLPLLRGDDRRCFHELFLLEPLVDRVRLQATRDRENDVSPAYLRPFPDPFPSSHARAC